MLPLLTRRVALSAHRSAVAHTYILPSTASTLHLRGILGNGLSADVVRSFANSKRNYSTGAVVTTNKARSSMIPAATGETKPGQKLTLEERTARRELLRAQKEVVKKKKAAETIALRARNKAKVQAAKKEAAALKRNRLLEKAKEKKKKQAEKAKKKKQAEKDKIIKPPPRRMSPFALFVQESGEPLKESWVNYCNLSEEMKQDYLVRARAIAEKRKEEFDEFLKTVTPLDIKRYNRLKRDRGGCRIRVRLDENHRRPLPSFTSFCMEFRKRPDQVGKPAMQLSKDAAEAWRSMTKEEKDRYKSASSEPSSA